MIVNMIDKIYNKKFVTHTRFVVLLMFLFIKIILFFPHHVYSSIKFPSDTSTIKCNLKMTSTCPEYIKTKWNRKNVGINLKEWFKSIRIDGKAEKYDVSGRHCKVIFVQEYRFFPEFLPGFLSPQTVILGKPAPQYKSLYTLSTKLYGPVWVDINNREEWVIDIHKNNQQMHAALAEGAVLRNGIYYGVLNNDQVKIGN